MVDKSCCNIWLNYDPAMFYTQLIVIRFFQRHKARILEAQNYIHFEKIRTSSAHSLCRIQMGVTRSGSNDAAQAVKIDVTSLPEIC
jgi:hypothetical protein